MKRLILPWPLVVSLITIPLGARTRLTIINASGYDSNLDNTAAPVYGSAVNDTKILSGKHFRPSRNFSWAIAGGVSAAYRGSGEPKNAGVWQLLPRIGINSRWHPDFLNQFDFKIGIDLAYSHKFHPLFSNSPVDDKTNILNGTEDDGSHSLEQDFHSSDSGGHETATETADSDVDDDFEDPDFVGQGSGQSYATMKSFTRGTYINNYNGRFSVFLTPISDWEFKVSAIGGYNEVGSTPGLLPASSGAHAYEIGVSHEILHRLEFSAAYQVEFRKFPARPAFAGSTDDFFVRTQQIPAELTVKLGHHMRIVGAYAWIYREVPLNTTYDTFLNVVYGEFVVRLTKDFGVSVWGGYALTLFTAAASPDVNRAVMGLAAVYNFSYEPLTPFGL